MENYKDSEERRKECNYAFAKQQMEDKNYTDAIVIFEMLGDYNDSSNLLEECHLDYAIELYENGDFINARSHFQLVEQTEDVEKYLRTSAWGILRGYIEENGPITKKDETSELMDSRTTINNYTLAVRQDVLTIQAEYSEHSNRKEYGFNLRSKMDITTTFSYDIPSDTMNLDSYYHASVENNIGMSNVYTTYDGTAIWNIHDFTEDGNASEFLQDVEGDLSHSLLGVQQTGTVIFLQEELPKTGLGITVKDLGFVSF